MSVLRYFIVHQWPSVCSIQLNNNNNKNEKSKPSVQTQSNPPCACTPPRVNRSVVAACVVDGEGRQTEWRKVPHHRWCVCGQRRCQWQVIVPSFLHRAPTSFPPLSPFWLTSFYYWPLPIYPHSTARQHPGNIHPTLRLTHLLSHFHFLQPHPQTFYLIVSSSFHHTRSDIGSSTCFNLFFFSSPLYAT